MRQLLVAVVIAVLGSAVGAGPAKAELITYTFSGTGTGMVGSQSFSNAAFTIQLFADTNNVILLEPGIFVVEDFFSTIEIAGFGLGTFTTGKRVFDNQNVSALGFSNAGPDGFDLLDLFEPPFASYDLRGPFGPVFESAPQTFGQFVTQPSTLGLITVTSARDVTFVAEVVPEPSTMVLFAVGAVLVSAPRLRRRK